MVEDDLEFLNSNNVVLSEILLIENIIKKIEKILI